MTWTKLTTNWTDTLQALARRFPYASAQSLEQATKQANAQASTGTDATADPFAISRVIAKTHDLTEHEAFEELEHFFDLQSLARAAPDIRSHDTAMIQAK